MGRHTDRKTRRTPAADENVAPVAPLCAGAKRLYNASGFAPSGGEANTTAGLQDFPSGFAAGQVNALSFWGRAVCGEWEISVDPAELAADKADLSGLTAIQLWIATQTFIQ